MGKTKPGSLVGQRVRIICCEQNLPEHMGQIGVVARQHLQTPKRFSVYVGTGICRAIEVEPVTDDPLSEEDSKQKGHERRTRMSRLYFIDG